MTITATTAAVLPYQVMGDMLKTADGRKVFAVLHSTQPGYGAALTSAPVIRRRLLDLAVTLRKFQAQPRSRWTPADSANLEAAMDLDQELDGIRSAPAMEASGRYLVGADHGKVVEFVSGSDGGAEPTKKMLANARLMAKLLQHAITSARTFRGVDINDRCWLTTDQDTLAAVEDALADTGGHYC